MSSRRFKRPESVLVLVYTSAGQVLMMQRAKPADFWQSVTGSLRWGESSRQAALRELREETGLQAGFALRDLQKSVCFPIVAPWKARYAPSAHSNKEHWFALCLPSRRLIVLNQAEHSAYRWLPWREAAQKATSWSNKDAIEALFAP
jgi:dATP pyrophosphohydrolase